MASNDNVKSHQDLMPFIIFNNQLEMMSRVMDKSLELSLSVLKQMEPDEKTEAEAMDAAPEGSMKDDAAAAVDANLSRAPKARATKKTTAPKAAGPVAPMPAPKIEPAPAAVAESAPRHAFDASMFIPSTPDVEEASEIVTRAMNEAASRALSDWADKAGDIEAGTDDPAEGHKYKPSISAAKPKGRG